jgi:acyl dehydratase
MAAKRFPVEASHVMMFARAIGDHNPVYLDEEKARASEAGGIIAPPTFVQAAAQFDPNYGLRPRPDMPWFGSGKHPSGAMRPRRPEPAAREGGAQESAAPGGGGRGGGGGGGGGLHAEQHYEYRRHVRPGDVLTAKSQPGRTWEKESRRAGKLKFRETITEYYDQNGELVIIARGVGMSTERVIESSATEAPAEEKR